MVWGPGVIDGLANGSLSKAALRQVRRSATQLAWAKPDLWT